jgi:polysaccharide pyruvyl transferase WcaK-like protein/glycosyltransferase involved in cell wall biosynthesis
VDAVDWQALPAQFEAVERADVIICGGGGLFFDYWGCYPETLWTPGHGGLSYVCGAPLLAALLAKPVGVHAVGVGPLRTVEGQALTRAVMNLASRISVRDAASKDALTAIGIDADRVAVAADPAFALDNAWTPPPARGRSHPTVGVALRPWDVDVDPAQWEAAVAEGLDRFLDAHGGGVRFIPFQWLEHQPRENDWAVAMRVVQAMRRRAAVEVLPGALSPRERAQAVAGCDLVLGMRLHSLIFALMVGLPSVGLGYDPKIARLAIQAGSDDAVLPLEALDGPRIADALAQQWRRRDEVAGQAAAVSDHLRALAGDDIAALASWIETAPPAPRAHPDALRQIFGALRGRLRLERWEAATTPAAEAVEEARAAADAARAMVHTTQQAVLEQERRIAGLERARYASDAAERAAQRALAAVIASRRFQAATSVVDAWWLLKRGRVAHALHRLIRRPDATPEPVAPAPAVPRLGTGAMTPRAPGVPGGGSGVVDVLTPLFFDREGRAMMSGGAERYLVELAALIHGLGYRVRVFQSARSAWTRHYGDLEIHGLDTGGLDGGLNEAYHARARPAAARAAGAGPAALTIYHAYYLAAPLCVEGAIGISHGVNWDTPETQASQDGFRHLIDHYLAAISNLVRVVSVDTNTINWVRATHATLADRFTYIPNFVDLAVFRPRPPRAPHDDAVVIAYPRRLNTNRGFWLAATVLPDVLHRHPRASFHFVGLAESAREASMVTTLQAAFPGRVRWTARAPDAMAEVYTEADIVIIPTVASEGTALSCLEALASGNAVIATTVGGLPELIRDGDNGLLIEPTADALHGALTALILDRDRREALGRRGPEVARHYSLRAWRDRWQALLHDYLTSRRAVNGA